MYKLLLFVIACFLFSCTSKKNNNFEVLNFNPISNYQTERINNKQINLEYTDAIDSGFVVPHIKQINTGVFEFEFDLKNNSEQPQEYYYKIYYQNESYKFSEEDELASENFYGSWENANVGFLKTPVISNDGNLHHIKGSFRIVGNPRNEKKYFGVASRYLQFKEPTEKELNDVILSIKSNTEWYNSVVEKAKTNNNSLNKQLLLDAEWTVQSNRKAGNFNNRWKRNPRVGYYSVMLVVTEKSNVEQLIIPAYIQDICIKNDSTFINPYTFFFKRTDDIKNLEIIKIDSVLKVNANLDLGAGIYIGQQPNKEKILDTSYFNLNCNKGFSLYKKAAFQQFIHNIGDNVILDNIPVIADVSTGNYSIEEYEKNSNVSDKDRIKKLVSTTECPCQTVNSDSIKKEITIFNPGNKNKEFKKEDVGIITRHGLTYGKYRAKVKLTSLLNESQVWNGITNAMWLIYESTEEWNQRRICRNEGFMPSYFSTKADKRVPYISYSEIDFEILKASYRWPITSYIDISKRPKDDPSMKDKIMVTCTNWDMACKDPSDFGVGVHEIGYDNQTFYLHRWDHWYNAVTLKNPQPEKTLFDSDFYYFEIEWKPTEIIWRIGPSKDKMKVVGYMNNSVTSIPNNQMLLIFTQEFHITKWWPEAPFAQDNIPFPAEDIKGYIYDLEIE
ncbi:MAG: hypothetical protein HY951_07955 [Bacteroidia bacterium]|nr:hypothetical protein [Bacteroidia bacterium]